MPLVLDVLSEAADLGLSRARACSVKNVARRAMVVWAVRPRGLPAVPVEGVGPSGAGATFSVVGVTVATADHRPLTVSAV